MRCDMARTRDRGTSDATEEPQYMVNVNGHDNHRVYEENELSAAEALMGINASPTTSHPTESLSASATSGASPPSRAPQRRTSKRHPTHSHSSTTPRPSIRNRNRGRDVTNVTTPSEETVDEAFNSATYNYDSGGIQGEMTTDEQHGISDSPYTEPNASTSYLPPNGTELGPQNDPSSLQLEREEEEAVTSTKGSRKRKRSSSVSVAAISRGQVDGTDGVMTVNGDLETHSGFADVSAMTISEPRTPMQAIGIPLIEQRTQNNISGAGDPETEKTVNGIKGRKTRARTFDQVVFGNWLIKTWYDSPYPISNAEDDTGSVSTGPSRKSVAPSDTRGRQSKRGGDRSRQHSSEEKDRHEGSILWVCERCFKYMQDGSLFELHSRFCDRMRPPGRVVYKRGAHVIYEIDGARDKLYCQNLSLFGKLFIDIKTLFFDCENFVFYVLTEGDRHQDHVIGFFSKEKVSYDDYNLACIITFPPYQRKRYGMLMIEFSYELSRRAGKLGTPERPLSELGLRTYLTYWTGALVQFFRRVLSVQPLSEIPRDQQIPVDDDLIRLIEAQDISPKKRRKSGKAIGDNSYKARVWEDGLENQYNTKDVIAATSGANDVLYSRMRRMRTTANSDGSVTTHVFARCTLEDIANATGIRTEDVAFALHECSLLQSVQALDRDETEEVIVISREMVEAIAQEFRVKSKMCMEVQYCNI